MTVQIRIRQGEAKQLLEIFDAIDDFKSRKNIELLLKNALLVTKNVSFHQTFESLADVDFEFHVK